MEGLSQLDPSQKKTSDTIMEMFELAKKIRIRSASKLLQASRGKIEGASGALAKVALEGVTSRQTMAPGPRSTGKSAAEDMGKIFQSDLIDFSSNARSSDNKKNMHWSSQMSSHVKSTPRRLTTRNRQLSTQPSKTSWTFLMGRSK